MVVASTGTRHTHDDVYLCVRMCVCVWCVLLRIQVPLYTEETKNLTAGVLLMYACPGQKLITNYRQRVVLPYLHVRIRLYGYELTAIQYAGAEREGCYR